ncbi:hypothetical protein FGIG_03195 [Fasciola gigantica]|uniref:Uncharacterized protein n=1 Tax=Fasciola gigantica TaxID=46835 RepID=A0A504Z6Z1_FASGI|nr:hypothetical protein FGIG_03195 [Fasciola gigantica]
MLSGGLFGSVIAWINFGTRDQNCITTSICLLQFLSWTLTCVIADPSENPLVYPGCFVSGLASGILYTALPQFFRHCPLSVSRLYFNVILPAAFCTGLCFINKCIIFIGIFNSIIVQLVILMAYWTIMLFRSHDTIWNKDPQMNSDEECNVEREPSTPCLQKKHCFTESTILEDLNHGYIPWNGTSYVCLHLDELTDRLFVTFELFVHFTASSYISRFSAVILRTIRIQTGTQYNRWSVQRHSALFDHDDDHNGFFSGLGSGTVFGSLEVLLSENTKHSSYLLHDYLVVQWFHLVSNVSHFVFEYRI